MTTSKLSRMSFSQHRRYTGSETPVRCPDPRRQSSGLHGHATALLGALWRQCRVFRLLQEKKGLQRSFERVAAALGGTPDRQQQTEPQQQRLARIRQIETELRTINYTQTTK